MASADPSSGSRPAGWVIPLTQLKLRCYYISSRSAKTYEDHNRIIDITQRHSSITMSSANSQQSSDAAPSIKEEQPARSIVKNSSRIPPDHPIEYWEKRLIGKRMIPQDAEGDEMVQRIPYWVLAWLSNQLTLYLDLQKVGSSRDIRDVPGSAWLYKNDKSVRSLILAIGFKLMRWQIADILQP